MKTNYSWLMFCYIILIIVIFSVCSVTGATQDPDNDNACNCPANYYLDSTTNQCVSCPDGSTTSRGATSLDQCCMFQINMIQYFSITTFKVISSWQKSVYSGHGLSFIYRSMWYWVVVWKSPQLDTCHCMCYIQFDYRSHLKFIFILSLYF